MAFFNAKWILKFLNYRHPKNTCRTKCKFNPETLLIDPLVRTLLLFIEILRFTILRLRNRG